MEVAPEHVLAFPDAEALDRWFAGRPDWPELWVRIGKAGGGAPSVTWAEVVDVALRWGWIDGIKKPGDADWYHQRLTPRRRGSVWSLRNRDIAGRLIADGRMTDAGLAAVDDAKASGAWERAYEGQAQARVPDDFMAALRAAGPEAVAFFGTLDRRNVYPIAFRLRTATSDAARARRLAQYVRMMADGERFH